MTPPKSVRLIHPVALVGSTHDERLAFLIEALEATDHFTDLARWKAIFDLYLIEGAFHEAMP